MKTLLRRVDSLEQEIFRWLRQTITKRPCSLSDVQQYMLPLLLPATVFAAIIAVSAYFPYKEWKELEYLDKALVGSMSDVTKLEHEILPKFNWAIEARPDDSKLRNNRLMLLLRIGHLEDAKKDADRLIESYPDNPLWSQWVLHRTGIFVQQGLFENAQKEIDRMITLTDNNFWRFYACMLVESRGSGKKEEYLQCYRDVYTLCITKDKDIYAKPVYKDGSTDPFPVYVALMGEMPDAEKIVADYLESVRDKQLRSFWAGAFVSFTRKEFLRFVWDR